MRNGGWILGGNALSRLPEFALGMVVGMVHLRNPERVERWLLGGAGLALGLVLYYFAPILLQRAENLCIRRSMDWDVLFPGSRRRRGAAREMVRRREVARAGRSVLVWHLSRAPALRHLGGTSNQTLASMGIPRRFRWSVLIVLSAWGIVLEKFANAVLEKIIGGKKKPAAQAA